MKNPTLFIIILILLLLLAGGTIVFLLRKQHQDKVQYDSAMREKEDTLTYHRNKAGQLIAQKATADLSLANAEKYYQAEITQLKKDFNLKDSEAKGLKNFVEVGFVAHDSGTTPVQTTVVPTSKGDSTKVDSLKISDGYLSLVADITKPKHLPWNVPWDYNYYDTLTAIGRIKKHGLLGLGRQDYLIDAMLHNKKAKITSLKSFRIDEFKDKRFSVGAGVLYDPFNSKFVVGVGIQYALFKF